MRKRKKLYKYAEHASCMYIVVDECGKRAIEEEDFEKLRICNRRLLERLLCDDIWADIDEDLEYGMSIVYLNPFGDCCEAEKCIDQYLRAKGYEVIKLKYGEGLDRKWTKYVGD